MRSHCNGLIKLEKKLRVELDEILHQEEVLWFQKSCCEWISSGDRNTKYFHRAATIRGQGNKIYSLLNRDGEWITDHDDLKCHVVEFYKGLFSGQVNGSQFASVCGFPPLSINSLDFMTRPICLDDVREALFSMDPSKAPGVDGFPAFFYQKGWNFMKNDLLAFVQEAFNNGTLPSDVLVSLVVLIPKVENPERLTQFRPISLCTVLYKLVTKVIVNRIKLMLPDLIDLTQSSFVPRRQITDNIIVVQEVVHSMSKKRTGKGLMLIKLDLDKAYDRLNWDFLRDTLHSIGLVSSWIDLIMHCTKSNELQLQWNSEAYERDSARRPLITLSFRVVY